MLGHYEDNGYGGETFVPYRESDDEAYEQMRDENESEGETWNSETSTAM